MMKRIYQPADLEPFLSTDLYRAFDPDTLGAHAPDVHLVLLENDVSISRCSLWWSVVPSYKEETVGLIGHYAALSDAAAATLFDEALKSLKAEGCTLAIGPMDGNTWRNYRFVRDGFVEAGGAAPFFLEPTNPEAYPAQWQAAGFTVLADYYSALQDELTVPPELTSKLADLGRQGIGLKTLEPDRLDDDLTRIFDLSLKSFRRNFLYTPVSAAEFKAQYARVLPYLVPELVLLLEKEQQLIGYLFALPDLAQAQRGEEPNTFIIKTLAVHPDWSGRGLATTLVAAVIARARELGFKRAVHALMLDSNHSRRISAHHSDKTLRRYALYARELG